MKPEPLRLLLADDDYDDCLLFEEALSDLPMPVQLENVRDGEQLMHYLKGATSLPSILFLDLNIPRKNGMECLKEIKLDPLLKDLHVVICSTSSELEMVNMLHKQGAQYYIRKPSDFAQLKRAVVNAITLIIAKKALAVPKESFVITGDL